MSALKRAEHLVAIATADRRFWLTIDTRDLRAVLALARRAEDAERRIAEALVALDCEDRSLGIFEARRALAPRKARAKTGEPCPGSGTDYATQAGWEGGSERCSSCGADVRVRDNGKLATHRAPRAKTGRRGK